MSTGQLTVQLSALKNNWLYLREQLKKGCECGAVVKANAYGLGAAQVAASLKATGCRHFFVASLHEALEIKPLLDAEDSLYVLSGCRAGEEGTFAEQKIIPVLISLPMVERWIKAQVSTPSAIKLNTGMGRLGLQMDEFDQLLTRAEELKRAQVQWLISHLACADEPDHPLNHEQLHRFQRAVKKLQTILPACRFSLANSAGIFLGEDFHFDLVRPGIALYGGQPQNIARDVQAVVSLHLEVLQSRTLLAGESVGYGAEYTATSERALITVAAGYADGIFRSLGGSMQAVFKGYSFPQVGRVSMDSLVFDVSDLPEDMRPREGDVIEVLGATIPVDALAKQAGTISYEILTSLGRRYTRRYRD